MLKVVFYALFFSSVTLMALEKGDVIPQEIQDELELQENQIYVIDFFASWCKSCKKELPLVSKVYDDNVVEVIGVNVDKKKENGENFVEELELPFPVIYDTEKSLVEAFDPLGFPAIYYVKDGQVIDVIFGAVENLDEKILNDVMEMKWER